MPHGGLQTDVSDPRALEHHNEEVRLLYVGMTRAKEQLHLLHAKERAPRGGMDRFSAKISPFLKSIPGRTSHSRQSAFGHSTTNVRHPGSQTHQHFSNRAYQVPTAADKTPSQEARGGVAAPLTPAQARAARRRR